VIDLRSDTLTKPTPAMLQSILSSEVGDDGRRDASGRGEDPTVNRLIDLAAKLTGKESATFVSTGTMGNLLAMLSYCRRGEKAAIAECLHIYRTEKAAFSPEYCGIEPVFYKTDKFGAPILESLEEVLKQQVKVISIESSNNFCGGTLIPLERMAEIRALADSYGVPVHLDGARVFNAASALGVGVDKIASYVDSVMFCISKGLGAPVGSLICGDAAFIKRATGFAKVYGAVMRQAGVLAAPGIVALGEAYDVTKRDNANARLIAGQLAAAGGKLEVDPETVQTNIVKVFVRGTGKPASEVLGELEKLGLKAGSVDAEAFRLVLHRDVTDEDVREGGRIISEYSTK
jgi:threonine aldolase